MFSDHVSEAFLARISCVHPTGRRNATEKSFFCLSRRHEISGLSRSIKISFFCHLNYRRVLDRATRRNIKIPNDFYYSFPIHVASPPRNDVRLTFRILRIHSVRLRRVYTAIKSFKFDTEKPRDELLLYSVNCPNRNSPINVEVWFSLFFAYDLCQHYYNICWYGEWIRMHITIARLFVPIKQHSGIREVFAQIK